MDFLRNFFSQTLGLGTQKERLLDNLTLEGVAHYMLSERCKSRGFHVVKIPSRLWPCVPLCWGQGGSRQLQTQVPPASQLPLKRAPFSQWFEHKSRDWRHLQVGSRSYPKPIAVSDWPDLGHISIAELMTVL